MFSRQQYDSLKAGAGVLHRADHRLLRVTGSDRLTYLQGLLTNDVAALGPGTGCYAAFLTAQGRMIADMRAIETGDALFLDLHESVASLVKDRLEQFIFSEDVAVEDLSNRVAVIGVYGPAAASVIRLVLRDLSPGGNGGPDLPDLSSMRLHENQRWHAGEVDLIIVRSDDIGIEGFDVLIDASRVAMLLVALEDVGATAIDAATAEITRIEAGRPAWRREMTEDTIPLEAGIEDRAISLTKGCYVGQEIIIRVLHRGHGRVARRVVGLSLDPGAPIPDVGDRIRSGEREIGSVTSAAFSPAAARPLALGYVHRDFVEPSTRVSILHANEPLEATIVRLPIQEPSSSQLPTPNGR